MVLNVNKNILYLNNKYYSKDLGSNRTVYQEYGWKNTGTLFKNHLISYAIEYIREAIDEELDDNGEVISQTFGIDRIPDPMLLTEMSQYYPGLTWIDL